MPVLILLVVAAVFLWGAFRIAQGLVGSSRLDDPLGIVARGVALAVRGLDRALRPLDEVGQVMPVVGISGAVAGMVIPL
jgi:hypothetical protein